MNVHVIGADGESRQKALVAEPAAPVSIAQTPPCALPIPCLASSLERH